MIFHRLDETDMQQLKPKEKEEEAELIDVEDFPPISFGRKMFNIINWAMMAPSTPKLFWRIIKLFDWLCLYLITTPWRPLQKKMAPQLFKRHKTGGCSGCTRKKQGTNGRVS